MRRILTLLAGSMLAVGLTAGPVAAMQPPGPAAQEHFGCVDGQDNAVAGHPGAAGLVDAAPRVAELTGNPTPTAWNAVANDNPVELGSC